MPLIYGYKIKKLGVLWMVNIGICDSVSIERTMLSAALVRALRIRGEKADITEYPSGEALLVDLEEGYEKPDLIFLDTISDGANAAKTAKYILQREPEAKIVFMASSKDNAPKCDCLKNCDCLAKPLDDGELCVLLSRLLAPAERRTISVRCGREMQQVYVDEVVWAESIDHISRIHMICGRVLECRMRLDEIQNVLDDDRFLRCHQSFLINMDLVDEIRDGFRMRDGSVVPMRVRTKKQITDEYYRYSVSMA
jgi:DNA-binding LytR/AlgR family response regulator